MKFLAPLTVLLASSAVQAQLSVPKIDPTDIASDIRDLTSLTKTIQGVVKGITPLNAVQGGTQVLQGFAQILTSATGALQGLGLTPSTVGGGSGGGSSNGGSGDAIVDLLNAILKPLGIDLPSGLNLPGLGGGLPSLGGGLTGGGSGSGGLLGGILKGLGGGILGKREAEQESDFVGGSPAAKAALAIRQTGGIGTTPNLPSIPKVDQKKICAAFDQFVKAQKSLLTTLAKKDAALQTAGLGPQVGLVLQAVQAVIDELATNLVSNVPSCSSLLSADKNTLDTALQNVLNVLKGIL